VGLIGRPDSHKKEEIEERYNILKWALTIECGLECRMRITPPKSSSNNSPLAEVQNEQVFDFLHVQNTLSLPPSRLSL